MKFKFFTSMVLALAIATSVAVAGLISSLPTTTVTTGDLVPITDISDGDNSKNVTAQSIADLKVTELSEDLSPVLGADLDIGAHSIEGVDATEFGYLDGVTSDIQTQINAKYGSGSNATLGTISAGGGGFTVDADGDVVFKSATVNPTALGPQVTTLSEDSDNGSNYVGIGSPSSNNNDLILLLPSSDPTAGQVLAFGVPSSVTFSDGVARDASQATWATPLTASAVTYENLNSNGDVGTGSSQVAAGDHTHSGYTGEIAAGSTAVNPGSIADGACATAVTATATGAATTDVLSWSFSADPTSTTGYDPTGDLVYIVAYPTENTANFRVCNKSGSAVDPGSVTLNWRVDR